VFLAGTGVRPEEGFGAEWRDVDLERRMLMAGADAYERELLDAFDARPSGQLGRAGGRGCRLTRASKMTKAPRLQGCRG
jgi:hypothetical protein